MEMGRSATVFILHELGGMYKENGDIPVEISENSNYPHKVKTSDIFISKRRIRVSSKKDPCCKIMDK